MITHALPVETMKTAVVMRMISIPAHAPAVCANGVMLIQTQKHASQDVPLMKTALGYKPAT